MAVVIVAIVVIVKVVVTLSCSPGSVPCAL